MAVWIDSHPDLLERFAHARQSTSILSLDLEGRSPRAIHEDLLDRGFSVTGVPVFAPYGHDGARRFYLVTGATTSDPSDPRLARELYYEHPDRGVVRLFSAGVRSFGLGIVGPAARKSVAQAPARRRPDDFGIGAEACAIGSDGASLPTSTAAEHGMRSGKDAVESWLIACSALERLRIGIEDSPFPDVALVDARGLLGGRTIVPQVDFDWIVERTRDIARTLVAGAPTLLVEEPGALRVYFFGDRGVILPVVRCAALASVVVSLESRSVGIDHHGYEASRQQLAAFVVALFSGVPLEAFDDVTGTDLTENVAASSDILFRS